MIGVKQCAARLQEHAGQPEDPSSQAAAAKNGMGKAKTAKKAAWRNLR
jgi:hypothetical protein